MVRGIESLRMLSRDLGGVVADIPFALDEGADDLTVYARGQYAAGQGPDGAWKRRKDGALAMQRPAKGVSFRMVGMYVYVSYEDVFQWHERTRPLIPAGDIPADWQSVFLGPLDTLLKFGGTW